MDSWLLRVAHQVALRRLLAWGLVTALGVVFCAYNLRYIENFLGGPYPMQGSALLGIKNADTTPKYYLRVTGTRTVDTGVQEISIEKENGAEVSRSVSADYYALLVGQHWLIVKGSSGMRRNVEGAISAVPPDLYQQILSTPKDREAAVYFYPFYLDATGFRDPGYWGIAIGLAYLLILVYYVRAPLRWLQDPATHPVMKRVEQWGDPYSISGEVERELEHRKQLKHGAFTFTDKYLIERSFFSFNVFRFEDLLWAYKRVTQRRYYYVIPAGKYYHVMMIFYGGSARIPLAEKNVEPVLLFAASKAPWAILAYSNELAELFKNNTRGFSLAVEGRRQSAQK